MFDFCHNSHVEFAVELRFFIWTKRCMDAHSNSSYSTLLQLADNI